MTRLSLPTIVPMLLLPCLLAAPAASQVPAVQQNRTAATPGETYEAGDLYLPTSKVFVHVGKTGFGHDHGVIGAISQGRLLLGATHDAGELVFDMTSFVADTDAARRAVGLEGASSESTRQQVNANMRGAEVLNVAAFPTARFVIDSATEDPLPDPSGVRRYRISGNLTLQSQTRPVTFMAEVDVKNGWNRVRGAFKLKQTDFGMKPYTKALGAVGVADEMIVRGELWVAPTVGAAQ